MTATGPHDIIDLDDSDDSSTSFEGFFPSPKEPHSDFEALHFSNWTDAPGRSNVSVAPAIIQPFQECLDEILDVFPDISRDHVQQLYDKRVQSRGPYETENGVIGSFFVEQILDAGTYPKEKDRLKDLKRKRSVRLSDEEEAMRWKHASLRNSPQHWRVAQAALSEAFETVPSKFINEKFKEHGHYYGAYFAIEKAERGYPRSQIPPYVKLRSKRVTSGLGSAALMEKLRDEGFDVVMLKKEIDAAWQRRKEQDQKRELEQKAAEATEAKDREHWEKGEIMECGCCFDQVTIQNITHCNGDEAHFFCLGCARNNANNDIGNSRYALRCMDFSECKSTFGRDQRARFLDVKTIEKLDRLQQQDEIRLADLQNLSTCPFCDFAAICPPVEVDKEFRCHNPECETVSCRLCRSKSHIPFSCEEFKKENGFSERRVIEEARTEALIRTCGKCRIRILKEDGCNKVICTGCMGIICDYCGEDITKSKYTHFRDHASLAIGHPSSGKCPLYDQSVLRKEKQIEKAHKEALEKVRKENPGLSEDDLRINFAKAVEGPVIPLEDGDPSHFVPRLFREGNLHQIEVDDPHVLGQRRILDANRHAREEQAVMQRNQLRLLQAQQRARNSRAQSALNGHQTGGPRGFGGPVYPHGMERHEARHHLQRGPNGALDNQDTALENPNPRLTPFAAVLHPIQDFSEPRRNPFAFPPNAPNFDDRNTARAFQARNPDLVGQLSGNDANIYQMRADELRRQQIDLLRHSVDPFPTAPRQPFGEPQPRLNERQHVANGTIFEAPQEHPEPPRFDIDQWLLDH